MSNSLRLLFILVAARLSGCVAPAAETSTADIVTGNNTFALELYAKLQSADGNLFFSPYSISTCLAMTYAGARGDTATQMARALHFPAGPTQLAAPFAALQNQINLLQQKNAFQLNIANALWMQQGKAFLPDFLAAARDQYSANVQQADFRTAAEPTRKQINDWVAAQTKDKITDLLAPGVLDSSTRLVLVNAIYFKGSWAEPFPKHATSDAPFFTAPDKKISAPFMHLDKSFNYAETPEGQLLDLPYIAADPDRPFAEDHLSMLVLLPRETNGLKNLEAALTEPRLKQWLAEARQQKVRVSLPKFKTTAQFMLAPTLAALGMTDAFTGRADFSGMDGARDLFISAVIHKAFVDVNETGTEAAAATGTVMAMTSIMSRPAPVFNADHPFLFLIRDNQSGSILFMGRINDPTRQ